MPPPPTHHILVHTFDVKTGSKCHIGKLTNASHLSVSIIYMYKMDLTDCLDNGIFITIYLFIYHYLLVTRALQHRPPPHSPQGGLPTRK